MSYITSHHIYHIISYHIISHHILYYIILYYIILYYIILYYIILYYIIYITENIFEGAIVHPRGTPTDTRPTCWQSLA